MDPVGAARLRVALEPERVKELLDPQRDLDALREAAALGRVEVEEAEVRPVGLSTREYHVFRSIQPMFTIQRSASSSFTSG
jgi:hypothetical protein